MYVAQAIDQINYFSVTSLQTPLLHDFIGNMGAREPRLLMSSRLVFPAAAVFVNRLVGSLGA